MTPDAIWEEIIQETKNTIEICSCIKNLFYLQANNNPDTSAILLERKPFLCKNNNVDLYLNYKKQNVMVR